MQNRIRQVRKEKRLTLAGLAKRCTPPTTAQTIGRLETGMRTLSLDWIERIAKALDVPEHRLLSESENAKDAPLTASLTSKGLSAFQKVQTVPLLSYDDNVNLIRVEEAVDEFRNGDILWLENVSIENLKDHLGQIILMPGRAGSFHLGRLAGIEMESANLLPLNSNAGMIKVRQFGWAAVLKRLIRNFT